MLSRNLEKTLRRALALANARQHEYATLEHLLMALIDDDDAVAVLKACAVEVDRLRASLNDFLDHELTSLAVEGVVDAKPTAGFQRVIQRAAIHVQSSGRSEVTGANVLVAMFSERESHAVYFLQEQNMSRLDAVNYISHGIAKRAGMAESRRVRGAEENEEPGQQGARGAQRLLRQSQRQGQEGKIDSWSAVIWRSSGPSRSSAAAPRTTPSSSAIPASARPRSPRGWRSGSCAARCPMCCARR